MRALITGGSGFVGKHLRAHLESKQDEIFTPPLRQFDICNIEQIRDQLEVIKPDVIYHLAGIAFVPECEDDFAKALSVNVAGTDNVIKAARQVSLDATIVIISSGEVYGKTALNKLPLEETDPLEPGNNYSLTKVFAEKVALRAKDNFKQKVIIMRPFNHIGPGQSIHFAIASFAEQIKLIKKGEKEPVIKVGNLGAKRDLTDVRDIVRGYRLAAISGHGVYNLCQNLSPSIQSVLESMIKISGVDVRIEIDPKRLRAAEIAETRGSYEKARRELGWQPEISLEQSLRDCINSNL